MIKIFNLFKFKYNLGTSQIYDTPYYIYNLPDELKPENNNDDLKTWFEKVSDYND